MAKNQKLESNPQPTHQLHDSKLVAVGTFQKSSPINLRWAIQLYYDEMVRSGVLFRFGRKLLIDPDQFWIWLKERGRRDAQAS